MQISIRMALVGEKLSGGGHNFTGASSAIEPHLMRPPTLLVCHSQHSKSHTTLLAKRNPKPIPIPSLLSRLLISGIGLN